jgi:hypothetical protein
VQKVTLRKSCVFKELSHGASDSTKAAPLSNRLTASLVSLTLARGEVPVLVGVRLLLRVSGPMLVATDSARAPRSVLVSAKDMNYTEAVKSLRVQELPGTNAQSSRGAMDKHPVILTLAKSYELAYHLRSNPRRAPRQRSMASAASR